MIRFFSSLSPRTEFFLVVLGAFGYTMLGSLLWALHPSTDPALTNDSLRSLIRFEIVVLLVLAAFLHVRGWRMSRFGQRFALADVGVGVVLAFIAHVLYLVITFVVGLIDPHASESALSPAFVSPDLSVVNVLAVSAINPVFEELILCGYIVTVLKERRGVWTAVNVSLAIRLMCHLYQGAVGVIGIVPLGFAFTYWYARTGRLWPVILAHALVDFVGLWPYLAT